MATSAVKKMADVNPEDAFEEGAQAAYQAAQEPGNAREDSWAFQVLRRLDG